MIHIIYMLTLLDQAIIEVFLFHQLTHRTKSYLSDVMLWFVLFTSVYFLFETIEKTTFAQMVQTEILIPVQFLVICRCTDPFWKKLAVMGVNFLIQALVEFLTLGTVCLVCGIQREDFYGYHNDNIYMSVGRIMVIDWVLLCVIAAVVIYRHKDLKNRYFRREMGLLLGFSVIHFCFLCAYYRTNLDSLSEANNVLQFAFQALLLIMVFIQYFGAQRTRKLMQSEQELRTLQSRMETDYNYYKLADSKFTEISTLRHDIQNQIQTVKTLLHGTDGVSQAENIIDQLQSHLDAVRAVNYCENRTINAVLTVKLGEERMQGIRTEIVLQDCADLPFDDYDLCSLVSNLFDNAVNACLSCDDTQARFIELKSGIREGYFLLRCTNSCQNTEKQSPRREGHGYGTEIMERICRKYGGDFSIQYRDGIAVASAALQYKPDAAAHASKDRTI